jgi:hypothetical protein
LIHISITALSLEILIEDSLGIMRVYITRIDGDFIIHTSPLFHTRTLTHILEIITDLMVLIASMDLITSISSTEMEIESLIIVSFL